MNMKNTGSGKVIHMMSPENYIRTKARSLPLHECLINTDWKESQMANVIIARRHTNGNITACLYLVDLFCQGVKDTTWFFNVPLFDYNDKIDEIRERMDFEPVKYELAHNIVFAAVEFAEEYGFHPHRDFISITSFMLEEDSDKIELIDIECGIDGKPAYMRMPYHSKSEADRIIATLENNAGPGNYVIFDETDEDDGETDEEDEDDDPYNFREMTSEERKETYLKLLKRLESLNPDEEDRFKRLTDILFDDLCEQAEVDIEYEKVLEELKIEILPYNKIPDDLLGVITGTGDDLSGLKSMFLKTYEALNEDPWKAGKKLRAFRSKAKEMPAVAFLELKMLSMTNSKDYPGKLKEYYSMYPGYSLIKLLSATERIAGDNREDNILHLSSISLFFPGRTSLHVIEMTNYLEFRIIASIIEKNPNKIKAFIKIMIEREFLPEKYLLMLVSILAFAKVNYVTEYFKEHESGI